MNRWEYSPTTAVFKRTWDAEYEDTWMDADGQVRRVLWTCMAVTKRAFGGKERVTERWTWIYLD